MSVLYLAGNDAQYAENPGNKKLAEPTGQNVDSEIVSPAGSNSIGIKT